MDTNEIKYRINFKRIFLTISGPIIIMIFFVFLFLSLLGSYNFPDNFKLIISISIPIVLLLLGVPPLILFVNYCNNDKNLNLILDSSKNQIKVHTSSGMKVFRYDEISEIRKIRVSPLFQFLFQSFYYYEIEMKNTTFIFSCLSVRRLEKKLYGRNYSESFVGFPRIPKDVF
jgi:hypothetical protein